MQLWIFSATPNSEKWRASLKNLHMEELPLRILWAEKILSTSPVHRCPCQWTGKALIHWLSESVTFVHVHTHKIASCISLLTKTEAPKSLQNYFWEKKTGFKSWLDFTNTLKAKVWGFPLHSSLNKHVYEAVCVIRNQNKASKGLIGNMRRKNYTLTSPASSAGLKMLLFTQHRDELCYKQQNDNVVKYY